MNCSGRLLRLAFKTMEKVSIDLFIPEIKGKRLEMSTVNVVPVFFVIPILRAKRMKSHGYQYCKFTLHLRCYDSSWRYPWVASNIVCAREWVIFSIILCFTPPLSTIWKDWDDKRHLYVLHQINKTCVKKNMSHRFDKFMGRLHFFQLFSFDNVLFFTSKKG